MSVPRTRRQIPSPTGTSPGSPSVSGSPGYIGPYRLLNVVNTGQNSQVWQAYDDRNNRFVAVKTLLRKFHRDREQIQLLKWEQVVAGKMVSDRIVRVYSFAWDRRAPYLALEWFSAPNMKQRIRKGADSVAPLAPRILREATEAVAYFNSHGWVHRDLKPDNFLVQDSGAVKLIDFALSQKQKGALAKLIPFKSKVRGTRSYMSPEQIRGESLDGRSDLYSLACTFFELLTGAPPFTGATADDLLLHHLRTAPPTLTSRNSNVTPELSDLIRRTMAKQPKDRPESLAMFLEEIRRIRPFRRMPSPPKKDEKETEAETETDV